MSSSTTTAEQSAANNGAANTNATNSNPITAPLNQAAHEIEKIAGFPISTIHTGAIILIGTGLAALAFKVFFPNGLQLAGPAAQEIPATGTYPILNIAPANNGNSNRTVYTNPPRRPVIIKPRPQQQQQQQQQPQQRQARRPTAIESEDEQDEFLSNPDPVEPVQVANYPIHDVSTQEHPPAAAKFPKVPESGNTVNYNINGGFDDYDED